MPGIQIKRPKVITGTCIHSWIPVILNFLIAFSPATKKMGQLVPAIYSLIMCLHFIALIGVWHMKRWGVELYIVAFFSLNILFVFVNELSYHSYTFVSSAGFIVVLLRYYRKMDLNL